jgi:8-oxo-dGTP pyrophosphatase MutT (NUDIX family)
MNLKNGLVKLPKDALIPAAVIFCVDENEDVLVISRPDDSTKLGLIGGKLEQGETPAQAAVREFNEETGARVHEEDLALLYEGDDENGYWVTCFQVPFGKIAGWPVTTEKGVVSWVSLNRLCQKDGPFASYNVAVTQAHIRRLEQKREQEESMPRGGHAEHAMRQSYRFR